MTRNSRSKEPARFRGRWGIKPDPERCAAAIPERRVGFHQCPNAPKPGSDFCSTHTPLVTAADSPELWVVGQDYGDDKPRLVSVKILKETSKQILLAESLGGFNYHERIGKTDGEPDQGARTPNGAVERHIRECKVKVEAARRALAEAEHALEQAEDLLNGV